MITILRWFLYVIILVDHFDIITLEGIGKGIKKEEILFRLVFLARTCINPGMEFPTLAWKESFPLRIAHYSVVTCLDKRFSILLSVTIITVLSCNTLNLSCFLNLVHCHDNLLYFYQLFCFHYFNYFIVNYLLVICCLLFISFCLQSPFSFLFFSVQIHLFVATSLSRCSNNNIRTCLGYRFIHLSREACAADFKTCTNNHNYLFNISDNRTIKESTKMYHYTV